MRDAAEAGRRERAPLDRVGCRVALGRGATRAEELGVPLPSRWCAKADMRGTPATPPRDTGTEECRGTGEEAGAVARLIVK